MSIEIRPCGPDELADGLSPIFHFFGHPPGEDAVARIGGLLEPGRLHAAWEDGKAVGGAGAFSFELTVPGARLPTAGVTVVGVYPTHRRRGILRAMMRAQLDDVRARGEPLAYLWASEETIYGRFGYGIASWAGEVHLPKNRARYAEPFEPRGRVRLIDRDEALQLFPPVYERVAAETPGMIRRSEAWWDARVLHDPEWRREGGGEMARAVLEVDGRAEAYALYRLRPAWEAGSSTGEVIVIEAVGATPDAVRAIWRFLLDIDWMATVHARLLPVDHPLLLLLAEPRRLNLRIGDGTWLRLVDVEAALAGRRYRDGEAVTLEVGDDFCPWNAGTYVVGEQGAARTDAKPQLQMDVAALASAYLGGNSFAQLARAGRLDELHPGAVERADRLFATARAPWCPEIF